MVVLQEWRSDGNLPRRWMMTAFWKIFFRYQECSKGWKMMNKRRIFEDFRGWLWKGDYSLRMENGGRRSLGS
jgi:hypothetical protein